MQSIGVYNRMRGAFAAFAKQSGGGATEQSD
jgi:hypothetical protein